MQQEEHKREKDSICSSSTCETEGPDLSGSDGLVLGRVRTFFGENAEYVRKALLIAPLYQNLAYSITERTGKEINRICHIQSCWMPDTEEEIREQFIKSGKKRMIPSSDAGGGRDFGGSWPGCAVHPYDRCV